MTLRAALPLYERLAEKIRSREISGKNPGKALLSELALSEKYGVSRTTLRKAIDLLERQNLVRRRQGSGTYIQNEAHPERDVALLMELDASQASLSPYYLKLMQEIRVAFFREGISSRPYFGYVQQGVEMDALTCHEVMRDLNLNRLNGLISVVTNPHSSWITKFRKQLVPVIGSNFLMDHCVEVDKPKQARRILSRFQSERRTRLVLLDWLRGTVDDAAWITPELAAAYGMSLLECRIPTAASAVETDAAWRGFAEAWLGVEMPDCLFVSDDMLFERGQRELLNAMEDVSDVPSTVVYGSDAVKITPKFPVTHATFSVTAKAQKLTDAMRRRLEGQNVEKFLEVPMSLLSMGNIQTPSIYAKREDFEIS